MKFIIIISVIALIIAAPLELIFDVEPDIAMPCVLGAEAIAFIILVCIYSFTHWGKVRIRASNIADLREKRITKESLERWNNKNRKLIEIENIRMDRRI